MIDESKIPLKSIFKSSEVCEIVGVRPYILRFWETEFVEISPIVSSSGKKLFEKKDILLISIIKDLLFGKKLTLEKAKFEISKIDVEKLVSKSNENDNASSVEDRSLNASEVIEAVSDSSNMPIAQDNSSDINEVEEVSSNESNDTQDQYISDLPPVIPERLHELDNHENIQADDRLSSEPIFDEDKLIELNTALDGLFKKTESLKSTYKW